MVRRLGVIFSSRRRRRLGAGLALVAAALVVVVVVLRASPPSKPPTSSQGDASGTATVKRQDLVETDTESGTIGYADPQTVYNRLSGTITWLPAVGQVIKPGQTLFRIDGEPVTLMDGSAPAYRDLNASDSPGADIEELNHNLVRLGFDPDGIVIDDEWQPATTAGVELLQESLGEDETGSLSLGQVVFLPGDQVISALDGTVGSTGGGGAGSATGSGSAQNASRASDAGDPEFVSLERTTSQHGTTPVAPSRSSGASGSCQHAPDRSARARPTTTTSTTTSASTTTPCMTSTTPSTALKHGSPTAARASDGSGELSTLTALLKAEAAQLKAATAALKAAKRSSSSGSPSASNSSSSKSSGSGSGSGGPATAILQTSSTQLIVTVDLSASSQSEAKVGAPVMVQLPSGKTVDGTITAVSPVAETSSSSGSGSAAGGSASSGTGASSTVPVTIRLKGHHRGAGLDHASVSVNFAQAEAKHVLSVPVTALIATAGGGYAVQEANAPYQRLPVTTGLFAAGDVQISGPGIHLGLEVTNSQG